ncbi:3-carboxy-cis,cis-muconate cycloisomerase [Roseovarius sp. MBR-6]|uniref:3-carboxy-cis,cis-muconate cycloisomerase n=1 Tax=Roseovarius sp. MBR-6 TaxID=3156459 RepID=UPI003399DEF9
MTDVFTNPWFRVHFGDAEAHALWAPERQIAHMLAFEAAFTRALGVTGVIPARHAEETARAIMSFVPDLDGLREGTARDGLPVPALVAALRAAIPAEPGAIHRGATSQDVLDTALSLTLREVNVLLLARLDGLMDALDDLAQRFGANPLMGRTRMQAALPVNVADRLATWRDPLDRHVERLVHLRPRVERLQLGGPVGTRADLAPHGAAIAAAMAQELGLGNPARAWHTTRDDLADFAGFLSLVTGTLGKMGQDICLMAQQGLDEIALAGGGTSSAMPHKQNPVLAELLVTLARYNAGQLAGMHHALVHEQERSGAAWALEWMILPQMTETTARALAAARALCASVTRIGGQAPG